MRVTSSVTSVSWIPSEAVEGIWKLPFTMKLGQYDPTPPEVVEGMDHLQRLHDAHAFRFANRLEAWIEVEDGEIVGHGCGGGALVSDTDVHLGGKLGFSFPPTPFPLLRDLPVVGDGWVRFVQTAGARTGTPMPRRTNHPPYFQILSPAAWITLALTLHADGRAEYEVQGASPFPRHWIYDGAGQLALKTGYTDWKHWTAEHDLEHSPWGEGDVAALVTEVESALERELSTIVMAGQKPAIRKLVADDVLTEQGSPGDEIYLLLDGVLALEVDGERLTEIGPGAILGERAVLEGGVRTATLRAVTPCKVAVAAADQLDRGALAELAERHRREELATS